MRSNPSSPSWQACRMPRWSLSNYLLYRLRTIHLHSKMAVNKHNSKDRMMVVETLLIVAINLMVHGLVLSLVLPRAVKQAVREEMLKRTVLQRTRIRQPNPETWKPVERDGPPKPPVA